MDQPNPRRDWSAGQRRAENKSERQRTRVQLGSLDMNILNDEVEVEEELKRVRMPHGEPAPALGMKTDQIRALIKNNEAIAHNVRCEMQELEGRWRGPEIDRALQAMAQANAMLEIARGEYFRIHGVINYQLGR